MWWFNQCYIDSVILQILEHTLHVCVQPVLLQYAIITKYLIFLYIDVREVGVTFQSLQTGDVVATQIHHLEQEKKRKKDMCMYAHTLTHLFCQRLAQGEK